MNKNSYFREINNKRTFPKLTENIKVDILIIGAGMAGLSCAYELLPYSNSIVIVDQNRIYQNTTSSTSAKVTFQHGYIYHDLIKKHGVDKANLYKEFNELGKDRIIQIVGKENIECDLKVVNSYLYALNDIELENLNNEQIAYTKLNIKHTLTPISPLISKHKALKIENQARFNVTQYLDKLSDILVERGVKIFENTKIVEVNNKKAPTAKALDNYTIIANKIIICSHYPFYKKFNFYFMKMIPALAYAAIGKSNIEIEDANYINTDSKNIIAIRYITVDREKKLLLSGATHNANKFISEFEQINQLQFFGKDSLKIENYDYTWSGQDYTSTDLFPYIGKVKKDIYIACAFGEWGMALSAASAILIKDLLVKEISIYKNIFDPRRVKLTKDIVCYNAKMIPTLIKTRIFPQCKTWKIAPNTGKVVKYRGMPIGMYKDEDGKLYLVKAICPHMRCGLRFNSIDKTYDCKCHGSRFKYNGKQIDGPAKYDLERIDSSFFEEAHIND
jgi:glycine/D-amino acid oxidase-like deaminating enzyme/nitrite reductase/ring-hydroxylating ferredoxin subunit